MISVEIASSVKWEGKSWIISFILNVKLISNCFYSYATSYVLERTTGTAFEKFYDAGRRGRKGEDCKEVYLECSESF